MLEREYLLSTEDTDMVFEQTLIAQIPKTEETYYERTHPESLKDEYIGF